MEDRELVYLRQICPKAKEMTDGQLASAEGVLDMLSRPIKPVRVGNLIEVYGITGRYPLERNPFLFTSGDLETNMLAMCEWLFIDGFYGPCCIWVRGTMEHLLQEICLNNPKISADFKERFHREGEQNPMLRDMANALANVGSWPDWVDIVCKTIVDNGSTVVHHRKDLIFGGKTSEDLMPLYGIDPDSERALCFKADEKNIFDSQRLSEERRMAKESLGAMHPLFDLWTRLMTSGNGIIRHRNS